MKLRPTIFAAAILFAAPAFAETLTNRSVIALNAAGLDADTIIAKIRSSDTKFDLSTDQIIALKKQGIPSAVIAAMIAAGGKDAKPTASARERTSSPERAPNANLAASRPAGIYLLQGGQLVRIEPNVSGQTKTGGFLGSALSYGIAKISTRVVLQGENARVRTNETTPTFYFILPGGAARANASSFDTQSTSEPTSPNEFSLLRLEAKKGSREARVGRGNITGYQSGVVDKDRINFTYDEARPGVFTVRPSSALPPGEYCFLMIGAGSASVTRFFDFSVQK